MIKPVRILLLLLLVNLFLGLFILLFPEGKIQIFPGYALRFVSLERLLNPEEVKYADISNIIKDKGGDLEAEDTAATVNLKTAVDSLAGDSETVDPLKFVNKAEAEKLALITYKIEFPENADTLLNPFFRELDSLSSGKRLIRILHFGDSQIEGDRVTSTLRQRMQSKFGGCGAGLIPVFEPGVSRSTIQISQSNNWKKIAAYGNLHKGYKSRKYGVMGSLFRFYSEDDTDFTGIDTSMKNAFVGYMKSQAAYANAKRFEKLNLFYSNRTSVPVKFNLQIDNKKSLAGELEPSLSANIRSWAFDTIPSSVKFNFSSRISPDIYGVSLDCKSGIAVDNIPMRGSSGIEFTKMDINHFSTQVKKLNAKLLILEFGVNVVPYVVSNYDYYEQSFYRQLKALKASNPGINILVVGVSDMSTKEGADYVSYPNIEKIREAQRKAAFRAGCAFWDMYSAMGGKNSMPSWVNAEPPLAEKDYTHFSFRGARIIGEMIYNALIKEYYNFKEKGDSRQAAEVRK